MSSAFSLRECDRSGGVNPSHFIPIRPNGLDLPEVRQVVSGGTDLLATFADYTSRHVPETITDAAGQTTEITYNSYGQPLTITNAKNETTTFTYETGTQNLLTVTGPASGSTTTFTYDAYNRVESVEGPDGYIVEFAYDALNRLTSRTYPDRHDRHVRRELRHRRHAAGGHRAARPISVHARALSHDVPRPHVDDAPDRRLRYG